MIAKMYAKRYSSKTLLLWWKRDGGKQKEKAAEGKKEKRSIINNSTNLGPSQLQLRSEPYKILRTSYAFWMLAIITEEVGRSLQTFIY